MSEAGKRLIAGTKEALAVARGQEPAASITINGHRYVPAETPSDALALARRVANLNPDAGEIGEGMLRSLVEDARRIVDGN